MNWKTVRIFISSTFNDMHAERDFLVKYVFPELSSWCRERKLILIDIDLRWGVSSEDSTANNTVKVCLSNIDDSRPFFLCFLGQRRGWIPEPDDISESTYIDYPGIKDYVGSSSVTEMEIEHALLSPMLRLVEGKSIAPQPVNHALFFFRKDPFSCVHISDVQRNIYTNNAARNSLLADTLLEDFKAKVRQRWTVCEYDCRWDSEAVSPELQTEGLGASAGRLVDFTVNRLPLKDVIIETLKREISAEFPDNCISFNESPLEKDLEQQEQFIIQCGEGFIPREKDLDALKEYITSESRQPFLITAEAGLGKTTLLANFILLARQTRNNITARFCGVSDLSSSELGLWKSIFDEHNISFPQNLEDIKRNLYALLSQIHGVVTIDGIDQLHNGIAMLSWLPRELPEGLKLIISLKEDFRSKPLIEEASQYAIIHRVKPFSQAEDKISLINEYLNRYLKHLDRSHMEIICGAKGSENPLFLKVILSSLRVFGAFKQLETEISGFGEDPVSAFDAVLAGLEQDTSYITIFPGQSFVPFLFGLLSQARRGLTEYELAFCLKKEYPAADEETIRGALRIYLRRVRQFMASRDGRTDFLYDSFRAAATLRYKENRLRNNILLADCFASICDPEGNGKFTSDEPRALTELLYHLFQSDASLGKSLLCNLIYINARCSACGSGELISDYAMIQEPDLRTQQVKGLLIRFSDVFSKYRNSFFSTALACNLTEAFNLLSAPVIPVPFIRPKRLPVQKFESDTAALYGLWLRISASYRLDKTVAVCAPKNVRFALFSEGIGRVRLIYLSTMSVDEKLIITSPKRPIDIFASDTGDLIAITFDDETAELIKLDIDSGIFMASHRLASFGYYLPMLSDGVFAFSGESLWYQKDTGTVIKRCKGEELLVSLPEQGDVTAISIFGSIGVLALRTGYGTLFCRIDGTGIRVVKAYPGRDILHITALKSGDFAVSFSDSTIGLLSEYGEEKGKIRTNITCALLLEVAQGLFCVSESRHSAFLWDYKETLQKYECSELEYNRKISASYNGDTINIISDQYVMTASIGEHEKQSKVLQTVLFHGHELILVFKENSSEIAVQLGDRTIIVPIDSDKLSFLKIENELLIFDSVGNLTVINLVDMTIKKGIAEFRPVSVAAAKDGYYSIDTAGFLHRYPNIIRLPSISEYMLSSVSLKIYDKLMVLTGISTNAWAGNNTTPYLMLLFKTAEDGSLTLIGQRYFPKDRGMFMDSCFHENDLRLYVFFSTPHSGATVSLPTVSYGTVDEFINYHEKQMDLYFDRKNISFHVSDSTLFICGGGIISAYEAGSLKYLASITTEGGFRMLVSKDKDTLYAIGGNSNIFSLQDCNGENKTQEG